MKEIFILIGIMLIVGGVMFYTGMIKLDPNSIVRISKPSFLEVNYVAKYQNNNLIVDFYGRNTGEQDQTLIDAGKLYFALTTDTILNIDGTEKIPVASFEPDIVKEPYNYAHGTAYYLNLKDLPVSKESVHLGAYTVPMGAQDDGTHRIQFLVYGGSWRMETISDMQIALNEFKDVTGSYIMIEEDLLVKNAQIVTTCEEGYTLSADKTTCERVETQAEPCQENEVEKDGKCIPTIELVEEAAQPATGSVQEQLASVVEDATKYVSKESVPDGNKPMLGVILGVMGIGSIWYGMKTTE